MKEDLAAAFQTLDLTNSSPEYVIAYSIRYQTRVNVLSMFERLPEIIETAREGIEAHGNQKSKFVGSQEGGAI